MSDDVRRESLEDRIRDQFPTVFITLVSVLVGLVLADLVAEARARMVLWPLDPGTLRTWFELAANTVSTLVAWIVYSHIAISRRHIPSFADALIGFSLPFVLLIGTTFVGTRNAWPWFYFASAFLALSFASTIWLHRVMRLEQELATFGHLLRRDGYTSIFLLGAPFYLAVGVADQHGLLSLWLEDICAAVAAPSALLACHLFLRDWHYAISTAPAIEAE
jgi:hypothetical protein